jgi:hypothetical protein
MRRWSELLHAAWTNKEATVKEEKERPAIF